MVTRTPTVNVRGTGAGARDVIVTWAGLLNGDDGQWFSLPGVPLRSVSVVGTFGAGGNLALNYSNGDAAGNSPITGAQADETALLNAFVSSGAVTNLWVGSASYRPVVTAGDGTTSLTITAYFLQD